MKAQSSGNPIRFARGSSTIEILIAFAVLILSITAVITVFFSNQSIALDTQINDEALYKAKQAGKDLPGRLSDAAAAAAKAAGLVAHDIGAGFLSGLGKPLLIGGAAVAALFVAIRLTRQPEAA